MGRYFYFCFFCFLAILAFVYPTMILLRGDDFGYVMSIVRTLAAGHPVTDDWIAANNLFPEGLGAITYQLTGNFYASTFGALFLVSAMTYPILYFLLLATTQSSRRGSAIFSFLIVTFPIYLNKASEYTGVPFYFFFFAAALLAYFKRRYILFSICAIFAFCCRDSGVALLSLPFFDCATKYLSKHNIASGKWLKIFFLVIVALVIESFIKFTLNKTFGQIATTYNIFQRFTFVVGFRFLLAYLILYLFLILVLRAALFSLPRRDYRQAKQWLLPAIMMIMAISIGLYGHNIALSFDTPVPFASNRVPAIYLVAPACATLIISLFYGQLLKWHPLHGVAGCLILLPSLLEAFWDYYFLEIGLMAVITVLSEGGAPLRQKKALILPLSLASLTLAINLIYDARLGRSLIRMETIEIAAEQVTRSRLVPPSQIVKNTPWGYIGFRYFYDYASDRGKRNLGISGFLPPDYAPVRVILPGDKFGPECKLIYSSSAVLRGIGRPFDVAQCGTILPWGDNDAVDWRHQLPLNEAEWASFIDHFHSSIR